MSDRRERSAGGASVDVQGWGWRHAARRAFALDGVDLRIEPGERILLLGASGSGKSTLLHGIAGLLGGADEGEQRGRILVDGAPADAQRGRIGLVLQDPDTQAVLARVGDDVAFGLENLGVPPQEIGPRVTAALAAVGLDVPLDRSTSALSGGQKQRLALAGVLAMEPGLILLDEPTANLDPDGASEIRDAVARVAEGRTLVVIEHRVSVWWELVTRVVVLGVDGILADGRPDEVLAGYRSQMDAAGIWLPHRPEERTARPVPRNGDDLLTASALSVGRARDTAVASDIDLTIREGSALGITGPNGAGKSTLALTVAGLLPPQSGTLAATTRLRNGLAQSEPRRWRSRDLLTRIGTVFQSPEHQFLTGTVRAELELGPRALGLRGEGLDAAVGPLLERLRLSRLDRANPYSLSGGEKRRLSVATVLATAPALLVLDEPTFGQDAGTLRELLDLFREQLDDGRAIVAVTHDREVVDALCDEELVLKRHGGAVR
ncbi:ABC transporter ATP-binding protein [Herbiconiux sp. L3-i23]|nr:ABC transporter ATP-binding protein [Herbiconiux sp. L3-i23]